MIKKKETVVIGMTGRINSTVTAYLLKKQGYRCIGVTILLEAGADANVLTDCHVRDLAQVKAVCDRLEIPFYAVKGDDRFKDQVADPAIAARLSGVHSVPCVSCNTLKADILLQKMVKLEADYFATGHYAKKQYNKNTDRYVLLAGNDLENDQSYLLANLRQEHLARILFPIGDMRQSEIERIKEIMGIGEIENKMRHKICFSDNIAFASYIEKNSAPSLRQLGSICIHEDDSFFTDHGGIHHYEIGQTSIKATGPASIDQNYKVVRISPAKKEVYIAKDINLTFSRLLLEQFSLDDSFDTSCPMQAYARCKQFDTFRPCTIYFKSNNYLLVEFNTAQPLHLTRGDFVTVYNKKSAGAKLLGGGIVKFVGHVPEIEKEIEKKQMEAEGLLQQEEEDGAKKEVDKSTYAF